MNYTIYCDGGVLHNQDAARRKAYYSFRVFNESEANVLSFRDDELGPLTNNQCEYVAMTKALEYFREQGFAVMTNTVKVFSDSQLVVRQLSGEYKVKNVGIKPYYRELKKIIKEYLTPVEIEWISRDTIVSILGH